MNQLYVFILRNDVWIYIIATLGLLWYINEYIQSRRILTRAMFGLERERGSRMRNNALLFMFILGGIIALVYYVNNQVAPTLPAEILRPPTPTPNIFTTPLSSPTPLSTEAPTQSPTLVPTITLAGNNNAAQPNFPADNSGSEAGETGVSEQILTEEAGTPEPPPTPEVACNVRLNFTDPRNGAVVPNTVSFFGTVDVPDFNQYRLEANGPQTEGQWANLLGRNGDQPVVDGLLGGANLEQWQPGPYLIRLTAVNSDGFDISYCIIQITLEN